MLNVLMLAELHDALPKELIALLSVESGGGAYIAGGSIVRSLLGLSCEGHDCDVWTDDADTMVESLQKAGYRELTDETLCASLGGENSRSILTLGEGTIHLDIIGQDYGDPILVTGRFDFRCAMVAFDGESLWAAPEALRDIQDRRLYATRRTTEARIRKYEDLGFELVQPREDVLLPEWVSWDQQFGRDVLHVGGELPPEPEVPEPPPKVFEVPARRNWHIHWVEWETASGTVETEGEENVGLVCASEFPHLGEPKRVRTLPYPASPVVRRRSDCPTFCHSPYKCGGRTACPQPYACSE